MGPALTVALVAGVLPLALTVPAQAETVDQTAARDALNAVCAASQARAETGFTVTDATAAGRDGSYDPVSGAVERSDPGVDGRRTVYTESPPAAYRAIDPSDRFARRALQRLGSTAAWVGESLPLPGWPNVIPSPGGRMAELLRAPGQPAVAPEACADALTANPKAALVEVTRTVAADLTEWRIFAPPQFFGGTRLNDNARILVLSVDGAGVAVALRVSSVFVDGIGGVVEAPTWTYGTFGSVTVPGGSEVVDESTYLAARASFVPGDLKDLARRIARKPLRAATVAALRARVENSWLRSRLDPLLESGHDKARRGAVVWQRGEGATVTAYRFTLRNGAARVAFARVRGYTP